jgi:hypothetical protein
MKKQSAETNSKVPKLARRDFVKTTAVAGAGLLIVPSAIAFGSTANSTHGPGIIGSGGPGNHDSEEFVAADLVKECDLRQGYNFDRNRRTTFGYINTLVIGDANIAPDIKVVLPTATTKLVVSVLSKVSWGTGSGDPIEFEGRVSVENVHRLRQKPIKTNVTLSFVVYEYDPVNQIYFTCFKSYKGQAPSGLPPTQPGLSPDPTAPPIYGQIPIDGAVPRLLIVSEPTVGPAGIRSHELYLTVAPIATAAQQQQIQIQMSAKQSIVKTWGIPMA